MINKFAPQLEELYAKKDPDVTEDQREAEFLNSPYVTNVTVSMYGEEGTMKPWEVADLDIFH